MKLLDLFRKGGVEKVEPLEPLPETFELDPNCRYVFWWERSMNPEHMQAIRRNFERVLGPLEEGKWLIVAGCKVPQIFEIKNESQSKRNKEK